MADSVTVGVAVAIPQPHATVLTNWRRDVGDPAWDLIWPHVTLLPPTPVHVDAMPEVEAHLGAAAKSRRRIIPRRRTIRESHIGITCDRAADHHRSVHDACIVDR